MSTHNLCSNGSDTYRHQSGAGVAVESRGPRGPRVPAHPRQVPGYQGNTAGFPNHFHLIDVVKKEEGFVVSKNVV